jgi:hypothetical protein
MLTQLKQKTGGITHIWPSPTVADLEHVAPEYVAEVYEDEETGRKLYTLIPPASDLSEADIWKEIAGLTLNHDAKGYVFVAPNGKPLEVIDDDNPDYREGFMSNLKRFKYADRRVAKLLPKVEEIDVFYPRSEESTSRLIDGEDKVLSEITTPAHPRGHTVKEKRTHHFNLGLKSCADRIKDLYYKKELAALVLWEPWEDQLTHLQWVSDKCPNLPIYVFHYYISPDIKWGVEREGATNWKRETKTILQLTEEKTEMHIEGLLPEKALTMITAPSFTGKTFAALDMALTLATGAESFLDHFKGPAQPVPVIYHVPELQEKTVRDYLKGLKAYDRLKGREDMFLLRPLEFNLWQLDSPQMIESARGRYVFLDTCGYFNDGDDTSNYTQAIEFAKKINTLIREGCLGVCGVYHPPKFSKSKKDTGNMMNLENQILGSAGYGGLLRSCIGMRNLHDNPAKGLWVYCQQLKIHGVEPFQIEGVPLTLIKKPGESPYLSELLGKNGTKKDQIREMLSEGVKRKDICDRLGVSSKTVTEVNRELQFDGSIEEEGED